MIRNKRESEKKVEKDMKENRESGRGMVKLGIVSKKSIINPQINKI